MSAPRSNPYVYVTWLTKQMSGEESCRWKLWFKAHNTYAKAPSDFDLARWTADHTQVLHARANELREQGYAVYLEGQNDFKLEGANGATLSGKADIVAVKGDDALVVDCKTGKERTSDKLQVLTYMLALPASVAHCRGRRIRGEVQYGDGAVAIAAAEVDDGFRAMVKDYMDLAAGEAAPAKAASPSECRFCDIAASDCPERVDEALSVTITDLF
jgi:RecB family exonuclease